ncbi:hypothetical protein IMZ31_22465 (plasmid) [Pontibacillus sp. ALD_SL1]|uniref:hypothetical protein n=1 Tax=Pontibacillus sp. ALD_SL1 TaxID=2777185 RepID=UPI001A9788C4|nr:hypothetical protein [Pontibacillus sp. ALD_SL1]QST02220.1 hypothetical protein IMZ31_22465 [Pontibacillus sp. ALD_SL1]
MDLANEIQEWIEQYCETNRKSLTQDTIEEIAVTLSEHFSSQGYEEIADIPDNLLAEKINEEVESA